MKTAFRAGRPGWGTSCSRPFLICNSFLCTFILLSFKSKQLRRIRFSFFFFFFAVVAQNFIAPFSSVLATTFSDTGVQLCSHAQTCSGRRCTRRNSRCESISKQFYVNALHYYFILPDALDYGFLYVCPVCWIWRREDGPAFTVVECDAICSQNIYAQSETIFFLLRKWRRSRRNESKASSKFSSSIYDFFFLFSFPESNLGCFSLQPFVPHIHSCSV